jgi:hypothetical protein
LSADARRTLRREQSAPLLTTIAGERDQLARTVLPKSPLGDAARYLTNQWTALQHFVEDGRLAIDNNAPRTNCAASRSVRKNRLFAGSLKGAKRAALLCIRSSRAARSSVFRRSTI